ncbi:MULTISPECIES: RadC family protein [unclassified Fusibacter]|uniref:JAB domain-containing protein n=1 Tax=unclassified Fusibacter TaxID=2624464 RepID=UPI0013E91ED1|nr:MULTISPECIES: DNA repair protein RadC [unclassified Fusibacter]MCK8061340.1 DNA repair protein RadC [Fusibacter sp. A2]NPE23463.1 DNA repair protein RadC [Fusibacter sp. A1]
MNYNYKDFTDEQLLKSLVKETRAGSFKLLSEHGLDDMIYDLTPQELIQVEGIGNKTAERLVALQELLRRLHSKRLKHLGCSIKSPADVFNLMYPVLGHLKVEEFHTLLLNTKNHVIGEPIMISRGSLNASLVDPRSVFRLAIKKAAASMVLVHNHPSMNSEPSREDKAITDRLVEVGELVGIQVLDHIIIGSTYYSFKENELI